MKKLFIFVLLLFSLIFSSCHKEFSDQEQDRIPIIDNEIENGSLYDGMNTKFDFDDKYEFAFLSEYSANREFTASGCHIELYQNINDERVLLLETSNKLTYLFVKDVEYIIKISTESLYEVPITFYVMDKLILGNNELSFMPNDKKIFCVDTIDKGYYKYSISNDNIVIDNVLGELLYINDTSYLYLNNNSNSSLSINLNIIELENINYDDKFIVNESNRLLKITNNEKDSMTVTITIESNEVGRCAYFYDTNNNIYHTQAIFSDGKIEYQFRLSLKEFIYVEFSHSDSSIIVNANKR